MSRDLQQAVQDVVDELIESGTEVGVQVAVIRRGEPVANVARGLADPGTGRPVAANTLFWAASTAKGIASSVAHVLADRGILDYDMPLVEVWPEFAGRKRGVTVRQVLCHTAGVPGLPAGLTASELCDWDHMCGLLAEAEPWWEPGTRFGYHEYTFGFLLGETLRRLTGHTISELLQELITLPLGVADEVHFGVPERLLPRLAHQVAPLGVTPQLPDPDSPHARALPTAIAPTAGLANRPEILHSDIPSMGTMTAVGVAKVYAALLGQADRVELVSPERLEAMAAITYRGLDEVMGLPGQWAFGYNPYRPSGTSSPGSTFGMVGGNGSAAFADIDSGIALAVMRNCFSLGDFDLAARIDNLVIHYLGGQNHD